MSRKAELTLKKEIIDMGGLYLRGNNSFGWWFKVREKVF